MTRVDDIGVLSAGGAEVLRFAPLLSLGMRLGEASGAALAVSILRGALACHHGMATFAEAAVSGASRAS